MSRGLRQRRGSAGVLLHKTEYSAHDVSVLTLDDWDTYFVPAFDGVVLSSFIYKEVDISRVVSRCRSANINNRTEESIISYFKW